MDATRFDRLTQSFAAGSRRALLRLLSALPLLNSLASLLDEERAAAQRRRRTLRQRRDEHRDQLHNERKNKKKKKCAKAGQSTSKKRKKCCSGLVKDGNGVCTASCTPATCPPTACGDLPDGCGGTLRCGCPANQICLLSGVCQPCTVTCTGTPAQCGTALQTAMNGGGTVYVCPGQYLGGFTLNNAVRVVGAGEGPDSASNTLLDAGGLGRVLRINAGVGTVELERLRITGGNSVTEPGAGIDHLGTTLRMTECTVSGNTNLEGGVGISVASVSTLQMTRCTIRSNHATGTSGGGGMATEGITTLTDCLVEDNSATDKGGGVRISGGTTTLAGSTQVRGNHVDDMSPSSRGGGIYVTFGTLVIAETCRVTTNRSGALGNGGGIFNDTAGTVFLLGAPGTTSPIVVNNCHDNCAGPVAVPMCAATPVSC